MRADPSTFCKILTLRITDVLHLFYRYSPFHLCILGEDEDRVIEMLADEIQRKQKEADAKAAKEAAKAQQRKMRALCHE